MSRLPLAPLPACKSCRSACCVGRVVYLNSLDVYRIASTLGLDWRDFAASRPGLDGGFLADSELGRMTHRVRLRHTYLGNCLMATATPEGSLRCGIASLKPSACAIYPYNVQLSEQAPYQVAIGNDAACPTFGSKWFADNVDPLGDAVDTAIADAALATRVESRWNALIESDPTPIDVAAYFRWSWEVYRRLGAPAVAVDERAAWQLAGYRAIADFDLSLLPRAEAA